MISLEKALCKIRDLEILNESLLKINTELEHTVKRQQIIIKNMEKAAEERDKRKTDSVSTSITLKNNNESILEEEEEGCQQLDDYLDNPYLNNFAIKEAVVPVSYAMPCHQCPSEISSLLS